MAELLKNMYNSRFFDGLSLILNEVLPSFDKESFLKNIYKDNWEQLELKQRMRRISLVVSNNLSSEFPVALPFILQILDKAKIVEKENSFPYIFLPDLIEINGINHLDESIKGIEEVTKFISAEFTVRPFILKYQDKMLAQMLRWSKHPHPHVRRLASEGCRPRLPWAMALPFLKKDPSPIIPILENLKADESEFVRRSVANNLNDISKDHPDIVLNLVQKWFGKSQLTDKLLKHACRTMIKKGDAKVLSVFGYIKNECFAISSLVLNKENLKLGDILEFSFECTTSADLDVRLEYEINFSKSKGKSGKKVFFLMEKMFKEGEVKMISRRFRLQHYTTRKLYTGSHLLTIKANGEEKISKAFYLEI